MFGLKAGDAVIRIRRDCARGSRGAGAAVTTETRPAPGKNS